MAEMDPHNKGDHESRPGYEHEDASPRGVLFAGIGLMVLMVLSLAIVAGLFSVFRQNQIRAYGNGPTPTAVQPVGPGLQVDPAADMQAVHATQEAKLNSYGMMDKEEGMIHMPIEKAMESIVEDGMPTHAPTPTPEVTPSLTPTTGSGGG